MPDNNASPLSISSILDGGPPVNEEEKTEEELKAEKDARLQSADQPQEDSSEGEESGEGSGGEGEGDSEGAGSEEGEGAGSEESSKEKGEEGAGEEEGSEDEEVSIFATLNEKTGYEIEGEFEENVDGVVEYSDKLADAKAKEIVKNTFDEYPIAKTFIEYLKNGGKPQQFFEIQHPQVNYSEIQMGKGEENKESQKEVLAHYYAQKGIDNAKVTQLVQLADETGTLEKDALSGLEEMTTVQRAAQADQIKTQELAFQKQKDEDKTYWGGIQAHVNTGKIGLYTLPQKARSEFYNWLTVPVNKKGQTQRNLDMAALDEDERLMLEYQVHKKFSVLQAPAGKTKAKGKTDDVIKTMLNKKKKPAANTSHASEKAGAGAGIVDLNTILSG